MATARVRHFLLKLKLNWVGLGERRGLWSLLRKGEEDNEGVVGDKAVVVGMAAATVKLAILGVD